MFGLEFNVLPIVIVVALLVFVSKAWLTVPQGFHYTLERFGKFKKTMEPGFHLITPFFEGVGRRMNMMEQVLDVPRQEVITKDNAMVGVGRGVLPGAERRARRLRSRQPAPRGGESHHDQYPHRGRRHGPGRNALQAR
jgi:hypothetical protein